MRKLLLSLAFSLLATAASAQCNGVFPANTLCGNLSGSPAPPKAFSASTSIVGPGSSTVGDVAIWNNTSGSQLADSAAINILAGNVNITDPINFIGTGEINISNTSSNVIQFQGQGNSQTTSLHLNPGSGTLTTGTITEFVIQSTNLQAFGGNYGRWSFTTLGSSNSYEAGLFGEYGGTTATGAMGPFIFQNAVENPPSTFVTTEFMRFNTTNGGADSQLGTVAFGVTATTPYNAIALDIASIGSAGHRDSHAILWEGKYNSGSDAAVFWKQYVNTTSNAGASQFLWQQNLNGGGWNTRMSLNDGGGLGVTGLGVGGSAPATGAMLTNAAVAVSGNGQLSLGASTTAGGVITGQGSGQDLTIENSAGTNVCVINTGTTILTCASLSATTSVTASLIIGGSGTTGTQSTFKTTTGNGTTDQFAFVGGNNGGTTFGTWSATALSALGSVEGAGLIASADPGGAANTVSYTNVSGGTPSSGTGTIKMSSTNNANSAGFIKIYLGTTAYWVPIFTSNAP